jgi:hypothetical protein
VSPKGTGGCHTPAFSEKRLQTIENKGNEHRKERKETTKGSKPMQTKELARLQV